MVGELGTCLKFSHNKVKLKLDVSLKKKHQSGKQKQEFLKISLIWKKLIGGKGLLLVV